MESQSERRNWRPSPEDDPVGVDIEKRPHLAPEIDTQPAQIETLDTYEERIGDYKAQDFTYIPQPKDKKYYNTEEGWIKELNSDQLIDEDTHLMDVLRLLQEEPFLLVDYKITSAVMTYEGDDGPILIYGRAHEDAEYTSNENTMSIHELEESETDKTHFYIVKEAKEKFPELSDLINKQKYGNLEHDEDRYGIITLADVNRRGMKLMLYVVFSGLVSKLSHKIENEYPNSETLFKYLRPSTIGRWHKNRIEGLEIHIAELMNILEIMQTIQASDSSFVHECGFDSKGDVEQLNSINEIRNRVMHANRSLIYDRRDIQDVLQSIERSQQIVFEIN